jgi:tetratricopeptide (TPR) repeat protein
MLRWLQKTRKSLRRSFSDWSDSARRRNAARWRSFSSWLFWLRRMEPTETDVVRKFGDRGSVRALALFNPVFWVLQFGGFLLRYLGSRGVLNLLTGLPAICGIVSPVVLSVWIAPDRDARAARAASLQIFHQDRQEYTEAEFFSRQLCQLRPGDDAAFFSRSQLLEAMGRKPESRELLLAMAQQRSYQPAIRLLCQQDLQAVLSTTPPPDGLADVLENNLQQYIARFPQDFDGRFMLAALYAYQEKFVEAVSLLQSITKTATVPVPQAWYSQAVLQRRLERETESRNSASVAADQYLKQHAERGIPKPELLQAIQALVLSHREDEALQITDSQLKSAVEADAGAWRLLRGEICAVWSRRLRSREGATESEMARSVQLLFEGIRSAPGQAVVIDELCRLCITDDVTGAEVEKHLQIALNSGVSPGLVHFILGSRAAAASPPDPAAAEEHFKLAVAHDANFPGLLNNMANLIADSESGNYDEGLKLVQQALILLPNQPEVHDTHGKLLLRLGQPIQAIAAFENALAAPELRGAVHLSIRASAH